MAVLTLADAKIHLNIPAATTTNDAEVTAFIDAAEAAISAKVGPLVSTNVTERVDGCSTRWLKLTSTPVVSVTSVTPVNGTALSLPGLDIELGAGLIGTVSGIGFPSRRYDIVYVAGRTSVPADLLMAIKEQVRHMWRTQLGDPVSSGFFAEGQEVAVPTGGWSSIARQLMQPYLRTGV